MADVSTAIPKPSNWDDMKTAEKRQYVNANENRILYEREAEGRELLNDPDLINKIHATLDQEHLEDHVHKVTAILVAMSGYLPNQKDHISAALKGDSSSGKDNLIDTILQHLPAAEKFTASTPAALRDMVANYRVIAFSEMNANTEGGANAHLVEKLKQLAEGGLNDTLKEKVGSKWLNVHIKAEQTTTLYATTETKTDEELSTRYLVLFLSSTARKNQIVVQDTLKKLSKPREQRIKNRSVLYYAVTQLDQELDVVIPYAEQLTPILEELFGGFNQERIKRDTKRLTALVKAYAWLYQEQRERIEHNGLRYVVASPYDFIDVLTIAGDFFRDTYQNYDPRTKATLEALEKLQGTHTNEIIEVGYPDYSTWCLKPKLQKALGITRQGLDKRLKPLYEAGIVSSFYVKGLPAVVRLNRNNPTTSPDNLEQHMTTVVTSLQVVAGKDATRALKRITDNCKRSSNKPSFLIFSDSNCRQLVVANQSTPSMYKDDAENNTSCPHNNPNSLECLFCLRGEEQP